MAQTPVEGYVFEENNRGYLRQAKILILELPGNVVRADTFTDEEGRFATLLPPGEFRMVAKKDIFFDAEQTFKVGKEKVFLKTEMQRRPGYLFDVTIAEARENPEVVVDAVQGAWIEIFNRTQNRPELVLQNHPNAFFQHTFERGNHYTILIRKPGFIAKRIEVYVNIEGCILCVDGVSTLSPGVTENLTKGNELGTLLANIELEPAKIDKRIQIQNIYYDFDKWDIRPDAAERLDKVVTLMNDNPGLTVELGSHTDSRGNDDYNMVLSGKRAAAAVAYIVSQGVDSLRITSKGYGESQLVNRCRNGVTCTEEEHQQNRRTELRITGISRDSLEYKRWPSLEQIIQEEESKGKKPPKSSSSKTQPQRAKPTPTLESPPDKSSMAEKPVEKDLPTAAADILEEEQEMPAMLHEEEPAMMLAEMAAPPSLTTPTTPPQPEPSQSLKELAKNHSGFCVEIAQSDTLLLASDAAFSDFEEIFWHKNNDGKFCYFAGSFDTPAKARSFFHQTVKPRNETARLVRFSKGKKTYFD